MAEAGVAADSNLVTARGAGGIRQRFDALSGGRKLAIMIGLAVLVAAIVGAALFSRQPTYRILYTNIPDKDGGAIVQSLQQMNVPYKLEGGGTISVPADKIYDVRLKLAAQGLPRAGNVGFELLDNQKFGVSQFAEQVNYQRAIEGELARSIETVSSVEKARVHLAMPKQTVFLRDQQKPTASVMLTLFSGRVLDSGQVAGIIHLVSSSIPDLPVKNVTVVDQDGNLLSKMPGLDGARADLDPRQMLYVQQMEKNFNDRIEAILTPIVGKENVRAEVTAQVDFAEVEQTSETFKPNSPPNQSAIRSQQTLQQDGGSKEESAGGVPGALSNQPPGAATAPITAPTASGASATAATGSFNSRKEATTNFEVDKTIQHVKQPIGNVKRLSAAVVLNFKPGKDKDGKSTYVPFSPAEMTQINNLVREAIGYNKDRGDSVNVVNAAFADQTPLEEKPLQDRALAYVQGNWADLAKIALIALAVIYLLFFVVRPLMRDLSKAREEPKLLELDLGESAQHEDEEGSVASALKAAQEESDAARASAFADLLQQAKEMAKNDPRMVATIMREWMSAGEATDNPNKVA
ncbi:flagellar M-ring protein FliF [Andreprevotia lacus DSM 23236]|jgi:flagellar M-ring protein FliF|uniref:Flagellar M-ring protein n=1 Tax=Andreprevotia lacus DSM 23236 TaxID=1121001 RepID=A0A1W1X9F5_9NEIS|nr:flagellar M-ring protein FliF [Andreprevotia lacus DSM 23236]